MNTRLAWLGTALWLSSAAACGSEFDADDPVCGNGIIEEGESCDGSNLAGNDCISIGQSFTSGTLGCNVTCDGWDTAACVEGEGRLEGQVTMSGSMACLPDDPSADCTGNVWLLVLEDDPATNLAQMPVATGMVPMADLTQGQITSYALAAVPEGSWYLSAFMDDDDNASAVAAGPDSGDPVSFPAAAVEIVHGETTSQDIALTIAMP